jgi:hypothetical protein
MQQKRYQVLAKLQASLKVLQTIGVVTAMIDQGRPFRTQRCADLPSLVWALPVIQNISFDLTFFACL